MDLKQEDTSIFVKYYYLVLNCTKSSLASLCFWFDFVREYKCSSVGELTNTWICMVLYAKFEANNMIEMQYLSNCAWLIYRALMCDDSHFLLYLTNILVYIWDVIDRKQKEFDLENNIFELW